MKTNVIPQFLTITKITSPSGQEAELLAYITAQAKKWGISVKRTAAETGCLILQSAATDPTQPNIFFISHVDTSSLTSEAVHPHTADGYVVSGSGEYLGADDKAGVAAMLAAMEYLSAHQLSHGKIEWVFSVEEEKGMLGSKRCAAKEIEAPYGYCLDAPGDVGGYQRAGAGLLLWEVSLTDRPSKAALHPFFRILNTYPHAPLVWQLDQFSGTPNDDLTLRFVIEYAGAASQLTTYLESEIAASKLTSRFELLYPSFELKTDDPAICRLQACLPKTANEQSASGGTDAHIWNAKGKPTLLLASGAEQMHTLAEKISLQNLHDLAALTCKLSTIKLK